MFRRGDAYRFLRVSLFLFVEFGIFFCFLINGQLKREKKMNM